MKTPTLASLKYILGGQKTAPARCVLGFFHGLSVRLSTIDRRVVTIPCTRCNDVGGPLKRYLSDGLSCGSSPFSVSNCSGHSGQKRSSTMLQSSHCHPNGADTPEQAAPFQGEIWQPIAKANGRWEISNYGLIRSIEKRTVFKDGRSKLFPGKLLTPTVDTAGYLHIVRPHEGKWCTMRLHREVAIVFVENPLDLPKVNHKDGNRLNNCASNLEWCTQAENIRHAIDSGLWEGKRSRPKKQIEGVDNSKPA